MAPCSLGGSFGCGQRLMRAQAILPPTSWRCTEMNLAAFRAQFPEFVNVEDDQVNAFLDSAATRINACVFGDSYDIAHGYLTAHMISASPMLNTGKLERSMGNDKESASTTYLLEFRAIRRERGTTPIVT